jgi:hypothetical protein
MLGALAHGLPLLVMPQGADQYANADADPALHRVQPLGHDKRRPTSLAVT